jgi:hypothetical protein
MFVSHEQEVDYKHFFSSLLELSIDLKIHLSIDYLVHDAWLACSKAALEIFPSLLIIMCWFHVMFNVRKHKNLIPGQMYDSIVDDIYNLHFTKDEFEFTTLKSRTLKKWRNNADLLDFASFFDDQWLKGTFMNWQIFKTPAGTKNNCFFNNNFSILNVIHFSGYATSNCPLEGYNALIKGDFTDREKYHMLPALQLFEKVCKFESEKQFEVQNYVKPTKSLKDACNDLVVSSCKESSVGRYSLKLSKPPRTYKIIFDRECLCSECTNCNCIYFLDHDICKHFLYFYKIHDVTASGTKVKKPFSIKTRRGRPKQTSRALLQD